MVITSECKDLGPAQARPTGSIPQHFLTLSNYKCKLVKIKQACSSSLVKHLDLGPAQARPTGSIPQHFLKLSNYKCNLVKIKQAYLSSLVDGTRMGK